VRVADMKKPQLPRRWIWFARIGWVITAVLYFFDFGFSRGIKAALAGALAVLFILACLD
jgi:cobalamin synthase